MIMPDFFKFSSISLNAKFVIVVVIDKDAI